MLKLLYLQVGVRVGIFLSDLRQQHYQHYGWLIRLGGTRLANQKPTGLCGWFCWSTTYSLL
jgi:hypothetical protein